MQVKKRNSEESSTQWTTGIAEVQLPIEYAIPSNYGMSVIRCCYRYKLRNIEETEAAKKLLQEKRFVGKTKSELNIPSSYSADYFQRGRDYAEKLRRVLVILLAEHPELYKNRGAQVSDMGGKSSETNNSDVAGRRQAATDEFMLERFRKRERNRVMRR
ncbi:hypothetical protein BHE74_00018722 [Ensete ventricosum]|uniref:Uncharacterized protein n=1 Tax=Ensete ventricosum TaxID=4639 RepID=A0A427AH23_ENSVE|nr:hypothetical protein B296_00010852 [Ensete ventricosum]RWW73403.1 hypothetical protein BHE74_00018722 [Ensete ventricosum]